ncbi:ABC-type cobalt transport system, ATPase component [Schinkia azotoformans MEV2011]|uniref:Energy-coupling factor transporter ATP-binding protein EcfA2 n=2 Tax=Schinkia azotoformans TaxID=1454 RepID=K6DWA9_SCHAZ|nr:energy-coupling factor ABC transporter ATP-binding protein [Schinkia azotoformans]EKN65136.1 cobalt transporter ATP-binding subunit [Schinkia azotoformans LMG 9581]KEF36511.1 ABC-type cobalt transport system, ATPase component [Schinkia azotoformans MEV2011]MEC1639751.1 energy-coupling factor ABC transporter ATP-binding protein [Schinkia azotoformans]MEC1695762.1 energy-coupling factor ABC transporter ATP-binding protein [Schinkia azotoformans]MEC1717515.1 energy-coupling factor ABC transpor
MDIIFENVEHVYNPKTPFERKALFDLNIKIPSGTFQAVIGHTGSGKSTLIQHINGLLRPTSGKISIGDRIIGPEKQKDLRSLRKKVGIVFQYPEHQLFEETVEKDICFGPMNFGVSEEVAKRKAREILQLVGLPESVLEKSPFDLSGGQMRRVAIAGVLAMEPEVLILDEPTAGLDPRGRKEIMDMFKMMHDKAKLTTILVTHSMEDAAFYADHIIVMDKGTVYMQGTPSEIFQEPERLNKVGLDIPESVQFMRSLSDAVKKPLPQAFTVEKVADHTLKLLAREEMELGK